MTSLDDFAFSFDDDADDITAVMPRDRLVCLREESRSADVHSARIVNLDSLLGDYLT